MPEGALHRFLADLQGGTVRDARAAFAPEPRRGLTSG
jgi:hypothetical protein